MTTAELEQATPSGGGDTQIIKVFRIVSRYEVRLNKLGPHIVDAAMVKELFQNLGGSIPQGPCLFDWKIEHRTVDYLDVQLNRWPGSEEGDVVVQGYIRYQIPEVGG